MLAAGHDCAPFALVCQGGKWTLSDKIDTQVKKTAVSQNSAFNKFKQMDSRAMSTTTVDTELSTIHQNTITTLRAFTVAGNQVTKVSSSGVDGQLIVWDLMVAGMDKLGL